ARRRTDDLRRPRGPRNGPRTPPPFRRRVRAGPAPLSRARACSPCTRRLAMAPALPRPSAGASVPDAHRSRALDHALPAHVASPWPPHSPILPPARPYRTRTALTRTTPRCLRRVLAGLLCAAAIYAPTGGRERRATASMCGGGGNISTGWTPSTPYPPSPHPPP